MRIYSKERCIDKYKVRDDNLCVAAEGKRNGICHVRVYILLINKKFKSRNLKKSFRVDYIFSVSKKIISVNIFRVILADL